MTKEELIHIIGKLDIDNEDIDDAYFGIFSQYDRGKYQGSHIKTNKRGLFEFGAHLLTILSEFDSKSDSEKDLGIMNKNWFDSSSDVVIWGLFGIDRTRNIIHTKKKTEQWNQKKGSGFWPVVILTLIIAGFLIGIVQVLTWIFNWIF